MNYELLHEWTTALQSGSEKQHLTIELKTTVN